MLWVLLIAVALLGMLVAVALLVVYSIVLQNGRILLRLDRLEQFVLAPPDPNAAVEEYIATLPPGVPAPPIQLPDLNGALRSLSEWRGQRVLLVFVDPECAFSRRLLPALVALTTDVVPGRPTPVVVSAGSLEANRALFDEVGFAGTVLLQRDSEVAAAFRVDGTPMSYLLSTDGTVATDIAVGVQAILLQAGEIGSVADATVNHLAASLDAPVTIRDGLRKGATAPLFRLPALDGGEISLLDFRGRPTVIVFTDPECEPCEQVAPALEAAHRAHPELELVMVSRGDPALTRAEVSACGLSVPVALQRHWELSRQYGIFATPVAFLVDEWGVVAADVAVGAASIVHLIEGASGAAGS